MKNILNRYSYHDLKKAHYTNYLAKILLTKQIKKTNNKHKS